VQPIDSATIRVLIDDVLAEVLEHDVSGHPDTAQFRADLGADSIALVQLADAMEAGLSARGVVVTFDDDELTKLVTIGDAVAYMLRVANADSPTT